MLSTCHSQAWFALYSFQFCVYAVMKSCLHCWHSLSLMHTIMYTNSYFFICNPVPDLSLCSCFYHKHNFFYQGGNYNVDFILKPLYYWDSSKFTFTETACETFSQAIYVHVVLKLLINHRGNFEVFYIWHGGSLYRFIAYYASTQASIYWANITMNFLPKCLLFGLVTMTLISNYANSDVFILLLHGNFVGPVQIVWLSTGHWNDLGNLGNYRSSVHRDKKE